MGIKEKGRVSPCLLSLFFWSTLSLKHPLSGQLVLCSELTCGHSGLSAATSSSLLWCFCHICFYKRSSAKMISWPQVFYCCWWSSFGFLLHLTQQFWVSEELSTSSFLRNSFHYFNSAVKASIFNDILQKWGKTRSRVCPPQLSLLLNGPGTGPTFNHFLFCQTLTVWAEMLCSGYLLQGKRFKSIQDKTFQVLCRRQGEKCILLPTLSKQLHEWNWGNVVSPQHAPFGC